MFTIEWHILIESFKIFTFYKRKNWVADRPRENKPNAGGLGSTCTIFFTLYKRNQKTWSLFLYIKAGFFCFSFKIALSTLLQRKKTIQRTKDVQQHISVFLCCWVYSNIMSRASDDRLVFIIQLRTCCWLETDMPGEFQSKSILNYRCLINVFFLHVVH